MVGRLVIIACLIEFIWLIFGFPRVMTLVMDFTLGEYSIVLSMISGSLMAFVSFLPLLIAMTLHSLMIDCKEKPIMSTSEKLKKGFI